MTQGVNIAAAQNFNPRGATTKALDGLAALLAVTGASSVADTGASTCSLESKFGLLIEPLKVDGETFAKIGDPQDPSALQNCFKGRWAGNSNAGILSDEQENAILASCDLFFIITNVGPSALAARYRNYKRAIKILCLPDLLGLEDDEPAPLEDGMDELSKFFDVPFTGTTKGIPGDVYGLYATFRELLRFFQLSLFGRNFFSGFYLSTRGFTPLLELLNEDPPAKVLTQLTSFLQTTRSALGDSSTPIFGTTTVVLSVPAGEMPRGGTQFAVDTTNADGSARAAAALDALKDLESYIQDPKGNDVVMVWKTFLNATSAAAEGEGAYVAFFITDE